MARLLSRIKRIKITAQAGRMQCWIRAGGGCFMHGRRIPRHIRQGRQEGRCRGGLFINRMFPDDKGVYLGKLLRTTAIYL